MQQFLLVQVQQLLLAAFQQLADEIGRFQLVQERGEGVYRDTLRAERGDLDAKLLEQWLDRS